MPRISVIMGVYNGEKTLCRAIDSILNQTFSDFEFIICNDCSNDSTSSILKQYEEKDKRVRVLENKEHLSLAATLNKCLEFASGFYIARMDDDDISHFDRFEKQIEYLDKHPEIALLGTKRINFDNEGYWGNFNDSGVVTVEDLFSKPTFVHPSVMMRSDALKHVGGYTVSKYTVRGQDFDLWCKLYYNGYKGFILDEVLLDYYDDRFSTKRTKFRYRLNSFVYHSRWRRKLGLPLKYEYYSIRPILVGLVPSKLQSIIKRYIKYK